MLSPRLIANVLPLSVRKSIEKNSLSLHRTSHQLTEEKIGTYDAPGLEIETKGQVVVLEPVGTIVVGARGRVDAFRQGNRQRSVMLMLTSPDVWELWTTRDNRRPLTSSTFQALLDDLLAL